MLPHVGCLLPTYNRFPKEGHLIEEAIECFLRQTYLGEKILVIGNDTPGQILEFVDEDNQVRVCNFPDRFSKLGNKIQAMIDLFPEVDVWCRWDDDDIHLPWRISTSLSHLKNKEEWHAENYWWSHGNSLEVVNGPANTHIMSVWKKDILSKFPDASYPKRSMDEDQVFNNTIRSDMFDSSQTELDSNEIFYIYRWGVSSKHLSGFGGTDGDVNYNKVGSAPIEKGVFQLNPHWKENYVKTVQTSSRAVDEGIELGLHGVPNSE